MIPVSKPYLPPIDEYIYQIERIYKNEWLTNRGQLTCELEEKIQAYLGTKATPIIMNNGTIPLQIALKLLGGGGEIITTPFSYVATTSTIVWEGCTPIFVDIDPIYWTIDEKKIEAAITEKTTCILATHVFGNICNVEEIERIAQKYNLYVIYDAAHCFGVKYKGKSIFNWGDISTCSFHATKVFHTGEGGAAFVNNSDLYKKVFYSHNFGHNGPTDFFGVGINGKISELQSGMGLSVLKYIDNIISRRKEIFNFYKNELIDKYEMINLRQDVTWNYAYTNIVVGKKSNLISLVENLQKNGISTRRYFYPSLNKLNYVEDTKCNFSEILSQNILALPMNYDLEEVTLMNIVKVLKFS